MDGYAALDAATALLRTEVVALDPSALDRPSTCAGWSVRDLLNHTIGVVHRYALWMRGADEEVVAPTRSRDYAAEGAFDTLTLRTENPEAARLYRRFAFSEEPRYAEATHWRTLAGTPRFGLKVPGFTYMVRPSAYGVAVDGGGRVLVVHGPAGCFLPGGGLESGEFRVAEPDGNGGWQVNEWLKKAVLLYFRVNDMVVMEGAPGPFWDKVPTRFDGYGEAEFETVGRLIVQVVDAMGGRGDLETVTAQVREEVLDLTRRFPIYA